MIGLLIANLVVSSLVLAVLMAAGVRITVLTVQANAQRIRRRPQLDAETVGKLASTVLRAAAAAKKAPAGERGPNVTDLKREKDA